MFKTLTAFLLLLLSHSCFAQFAPLRVSPNLTVSMPDHPDTSSRGGVTIYMAITDSMSFQAGADSKNLKINSEEDFKISLRGFVHGYSPKLAGYTVQQTDTSIGGTKGLFMYAVSKDTLRRAAQVYMFFTAIEGRCHFVQCLTWSDKPAMAGVNEFFQSVHFTGENYPKKDLVYAISDRFGQVLGFLLVFGALFLLVRWVARKVRTRRI